MDPLIVVVLYPLWAIALSVGVLTVRLGRASRTGLIVYSFGLALWVTALIALEHPATRTFAIRAMPCGSFIAAGVVHAGLDLHNVAGEERRRALSLSYGPAAVVSAIGLFDPTLYYVGDIASAGTIFYPLAVFLTAWTAVVFIWLTRRALVVSREQQLRYRQAWALVIACAFGAMGGGGIVLGRVLLGIPIVAAAPGLTVAIALTAYALLAGETGSAGRLVRQGALYAVLTALLSAFGLSVFFYLLPELLPHGSASPVWLALVIFFAALPLDPMRGLVVDALARRLFQDPTGVRDLAEHAERTEVRADHNERLAEIGALASAVAHEIRNPLGIIAAEAKLLARAGAPEESVLALKREVARAGGFVDDLLRYGRPKPLSLGVIDVRVGVDTAKARVESATTDPAITVSIETEFEDLSRCMVEADADGFVDVLTILLHNAIAATAETQNPKIALSAHFAAPNLEISVEDNGPGVPTALERTMMNPFVSGRGRDATFPGTGLGLAIAHRWLARHRGEIRYARSSRLGGAHFTASWPARTA